MSTLRSQHATTGLDTTTLLARLRQLMPVIVAAGAVLGAMILVPPAAAETEVGRNCDAIGGKYTFLVTSNGTTVETCCYQSLNPEVPGEQCDTYLDGEYVERGNQTTPPTTMRPRPPIPTGPPPTAVNPG